MSKILLIDDDKLLRGTLREMLVELGCQVTEAEDGHDGLSKLERSNPDLIITDILMPNKEGIETIVELKQMRPDLPVVAISGGGGTGNMTFLEFAQKLGASRILRKPIRLDELERLVNDLRERRL